VSRPTVADAERWTPDALREAADAWDAAATDLHAHVETAVQDVDASREFWTGSAARSARLNALDVGRASQSLARAMVMAAVAARDGADQIAAAQADVLARVTDARADGFAVGDDGAVVAPPASSLLVALSGGDAAVAGDLLALRAAELTRQIGEDLDRLGDADRDAAADIEEAFTLPVDGPAATTPANWPAMGQDRIAEQIAAMTQDERERLVAAFPRQIGNTDGVPWDMRIEANRVNIAQAIIDTRDPGRVAFYRGLLSEIDDPAGGGVRVDRQILAFDPGRAALVELNGNLSTAGSIAVFVPGLNTTIEGSAANTQTARRFVSATRGEVAAITYLGGPFPSGNPVIGVVDAADPRYALDMAPRLVAFSEDVERTAQSIPVTYVGHSYGGSILGTAEAMGLTADRTLYLAAAGAGVGVDDAADWHNRNPHVLRFSMTAPGDLIQAVQGIPGGPHGADPDRMPGVIPLATGYYDDGRLMAGPSAHTDIVNWPSDSWRNILAVITGDSETLHKAG
jgi:uncharacterized protein YukE